MSQVTLYLDDETDALLATAAERSGLSKSRWVAQAIRHHAAQEWPQACLQLAGAFPDFPLRGQADGSTLPADLQRVGF